MLKNKLNLKNTLLTTLIYIAVMGVGMFIMHTVMGQAYGYKMVGTILWVEVILSLLCIVFVFRYSSWKEVGFGRLHWKPVLWLVPSFILIAYIWFDLFHTISMSDIDATNIHQILIIGMATLLVGFSEETMFRGILLRGALTQKRMFTSIFISTAAFSLLHAVNVLGGVPISDIGFQLLNTFIFGLFLAPLALEIGNLTPLIIFHWLWDFSILTAASLNHDIPIALIGIGINIIFAIILLWRVKRDVASVNL